MAIIANPLNAPRHHYISYGGFIENQFLSDLTSPDGIEPVELQGLLRTNTVEQLELNVANGGTYTFEVFTILGGSRATALSIYGVPSFQGLRVNVVGFDNSFIQFDLGTYEVDNGLPVQIFELPRLGPLFFKYKITISRPGPSLATVKLINLSLGELLKIPQTTGLGWTPPTLAQRASRKRTVSRTGLYVGSSTRGLVGTCEFTIPYVEVDWVRANWVDFLEYLNIVSPCFYQSWSHENYPQDAAFCWIDSDEKRPSYSMLGTHMDLPLKFKAVQ